MRAMTNGGRGRDAEHIVFYGSLCRREPSHPRLGLDRALAFVGERDISGILYDLGAYPGLVFGAGRVRAELFRILDPSVLDRLDRYEGCDPVRAAASLFVRETLSVPRFNHSSAGRLEAWVYVWNGSIAGRPRIAGRSWFEYRTLSSRQRERAASAAGTPAPDRDRRP